MATSQTLSAGGSFPEGASVGAYPRSAWGAEGVSGPPTGAATNTQTVTSGVLAFSGLTDNTDYVAYAQVSGQDRFRRFSTREGSLASAGSGSAKVFKITDEGALPNVGDAAVAIRSARDKAYAYAQSTGLSAIVEIPEGDWLIASQEQTTDRAWDQTAGVGEGMTWRPGVGLRTAGAAGTRFHYTLGASANLFEVTPPWTATAITGNVAYGDKTFTVADSSSFVVGETVYLHVGQNPDDAAETWFTSFATVTAKAAGTVTVDVPSETTLDVGVVTTAKHKRIIRFPNGPMQNIEFGGFSVYGTNNLRHAIGGHYLRNVKWGQLYGEDTGSGLFNVGYYENLRADTIRIAKSGAYANGNKGRAVSVLNGRNFVIDTLEAEGCEGSAVSLESFGSLSIRNLLLKNTAPSRINSTLMVTSTGSDLVIRDLTFAGNTTDSLWTRGGGTTATGTIRIENLLCWAKIADMRSIPLGRITGLLRGYDATGAMKTWRMDRVERSEVVFDLANGLDETKDLRDGLLLSTEVLVGTGVTGAQLTQLRWRRTGGSYTNLTWAAGQVTREVKDGGSVVDTRSIDYAKAVQVNVQTAAAANFAGTEKVVVVAYTVREVEASGATVINEPGTESYRRFTSTPDLSPLDSDQGQPGIIVPGSRHVLGTGAGAALTANRAYAMRFRVSRQRRFASAEFVLTVAAAADDHCDAGIYTVAGGLLVPQTRAGETAGKLNVATPPTIQTLAFAAFVCKPGVDYYAVFSCGAFGGAAASVLMTNPGSTMMSQLFGGAPPQRDIGFQNTIWASGLPATSISMSASGIQAVPILALLDG